MQIHELNPFTGSPTDSDYIAIDNGSETLRIALKSAITAIASAISGVFVSMTNPKYTLDTSAASGTTDGDLYAAIVALGWESDVIE